tara:strand:- start:4445 stop:5275 length:831 start_codon:yes stop_codon:yes gene_type:complete
MIKSRKCCKKGCNNICLFGIEIYTDIKFCYKHRNFNDRIYELELGFFEANNYEELRPKKTEIFSYSYFIKLISVVKKIIKLRHDCIYVSRRNQINYYNLDLIFAYKLLLDMLLKYKKTVSRFSILNDGVCIPKIPLVDNNYLKFDSSYYRTNVTMENTPTSFHFNMINTFESLSSFHGELNIIPYQKDILIIKKNLEKYHYGKFQKNFVKELQSISSDSISIIEDYYFKNCTYDDVFNKTFLNKKSLNNDFLRNIIIMGDRNRTCIYFFNKNKIKI